MRLTKRIARSIPLLLYKRHSINWTKTTFSARKGEAYSKKLIEAGVEVTSIRVLATFHDFAMLNGLAGTPASKAAIELAAVKLGEALSTDSKSRAAAAS